MTCFNHTEEIHDELFTTWITLMYSTCTESFGQWNRRRGWCPVQVRGIWIMLSLTCFNTGLTVKLSCSWIWWSSEISSNFLFYSVHHDFCPNTDSATKISIFHLWLQLALKKLYKCLSLLVNRSKLPQTKKAVTVPGEGRKEFTWCYWFIYMQEIAENKI